MACMRTHAQAHAQTEHTDKHTQLLAVQGQGAGCAVARHAAVVRRRHYCLWSAHPPRTRTPPPPQRPCDVASARACRLRRAPWRRPRVAGGTHRRGPCACGRELRNTRTGERRQRAGAAAHSACARAHALFQARLGFGPSATADAAQVSDERKVAVASPIALLKACKNAAEIAGMRDAHVRAGAVPSFAQTSRRRCGSAGRMRARAVGRGRYAPLPPGLCRTQRPPPPCTESRRGALLGCSASLAHAVPAAGRGVPGDSRSRRLGACDRQAWVR